MDRVNKLLANRNYQLYLESNREEEWERNFCRHHFAHLLDVARLTYLLLLEEEKVVLISKEIAYAAGLLHDIGRWHQYKFDTDHAKYSAFLAEPILEETGFKAEENRLITKAISQHRLNMDLERNEGRHFSPLSKALNRADNLSRLCYQCTAKDQCKKINQQPQKERLIY
ncbi:MAG: HD domain-containing protein [Bacillota bacterium]